jgi:biopolymer transport protein ExbD
MNPLIESISHYVQNSAFPALLLDAWLKSLAVLALAASLCFLLRRAAAATRHWIWFLALATLPCLLLLAWIPHTWQRPLWSVSTGLNSGNQVTLVLNLAPASATRNSAHVTSPAGASAAAAGRPASRNHQPIAATFSRTALTVAVTVWLSGAMLSLASILAARAQLSRLARHGVTVLVGTRSTASLNSLPKSCTQSNASPPVEAAPLRGTPNPLPTAPLVPTADWALLLQETRDRLRLRRPVRLLQSSDNPMPLTWGWWRPVVLLPADAANWPTDRRRIVLLHELAHAKRWDCLTQTIARLVCALYWINPLAWLAARRMCLERERACDDLVLHSGCRPSEYATHLVDIARAFCHAPQLAGIAMARSPQLHGRIAAIVDASRARQLRPFTALTLLALMGALVLAVGGRGQDTPPTEAWDSPLRQAQLARLQSFAQAKEKQSEHLAAAAGESISPEFQRFFDAAIKGDWQTVTNRYEYFKKHHPQYARGTNAFDVNLRTAYWQPVLELCLAYDHVVNCDPKYTAILADGIINSIPAGSIYFGGTDPGRGVPTAFSKSHADADPFFTLTQNALADATYLQYLRAMYGGKIYTPTGEDSQHCFETYLADATRRLQEGKLKPGENVKSSDNRVEVSGQVAVMSINGLLTKVIFDHNPDREFYIEESFPLDWMYPYLEPHGLIMKINRQPMPQLPEDVIAQDHDYWRNLVAGMLGDWLNEQTTVREIVEFADRVYVRHDLTGFTGDPRFVQNAYAKQGFSKLRSDIAGVYAWRLGAADVPAPPEYQPNSEAERQALLKEADLAFRQSFALCPYSPEALFRYARLLQQSNRTDDALLLTETFLKLDPENNAVQGLLRDLKNSKSQPLVGEITTQLDTLRKHERELLLVYKDTHPLVQTVKSQIATLEKQKAELEQAFPASKPVVFRFESKRVLPRGAEAKPLTNERLKEEVLAAVAKTPHLRVVFTADKNVPTKQVIETPDATKAAKFNSVEASTGTLTGPQALALAQQLANEKAQALYNCQPFRNGPPAKLVQGYWVWHDQRGQGAGDVEATVKFAADGTNPDVNVILLDSRPVHSGF